MCLYPRLIKNMKYRPNKKNGGDVPHWHDQRVLTVPVGCGKCIECRKQKARAWQVRMLEEVRHNKNGKFVTLTFSNEQLKYIVEGKDTKGKQITDKLTEEGYELDNKIATVAVRRWMERWRKIHGTSLRHWLVTELGHNGTENIHLHGIIWTNENVNKIEETWQYGYVWKGKRNKGGSLDNYVNEKTVNYIVKYISKGDNLHKEYKSKILTSAGIGRGYTQRSDADKNKYRGEATRDYYTTREGHKIAMPIYWRNKIYNEEEREKLWLQMLDKQERWVLGQRIDISESEEEYYRQLNRARNKNKRLGYGDNETNWERKGYEHERRILKHMERMGSNQGSAPNPGETLK